MKIVGLDLDGTLVRCNSFPLWVKHVFISLIKDIEVYKAMLILAYYSMRLTRLVNHAAFKRRLISLDIPNSYNYSFSKLLIGRYVNRPLLNHLASSQPAKVYITTAAPHCYAQYIPEFLDFPVQAVIATQWINGEFFENFGDKKVVSFKRLNEGRCDLFCTDHYEDLPMMMWSKEVILVSPKEGTCLLYTSPSPRDS